MVLLRPPFAQVPLAVVLAARVVEAVADLVADDRADRAVVDRGVSLRIEERRLQNPGGEDDAVNYGAIGSVIGHEISHGFDDQGRKSDGDGNLRDWWTADDAKRFDERAAKLGAQFESYDPMPGMKINGKQTMGENIGDLSGIAVAFRAYQMSLKSKKSPVIGGFTGEQRFFLGYAQVWRFKQREEGLRNQLLTDVHSPGTFRAFVPLTNIDAFYTAFELKPGDKLYRPPSERVKIW